MRGLRGLAGAIALAVLAGDARAQYYPYNPYPQTVPYGYGGYARPVPVYNPPAPGTYYPAPVNTLPANSYPARTPYYQPVPSSYGSAPPIFPQSALQQPSARQSRYGPPSVTSPQVPAIPPMLPPSMNLAPGTPNNPIVIPAQPVSPPSFPRSLPSDPKSNAPLPSGKDAKSATVKESAKDQTPAKDQADSKKTGTDKEAADAATQDDKPTDDKPVQAGPTEAGPVQAGPDIIGPIPGDAPAAPERRSFIEQVFAPATQPYMPRMWGGVEYLLWRVSPGPIRVPLVTTNPNTAPAGAIGALGEPGTTIVFGAGSGHNVNYNDFSGGRFNAGIWLDPDRTFGIEGSGFALERRDAIFSASSPGGTAPIVSIPFFATQPYNFNPPGETSLNAGGGANTVSVNNYSHLWGMEVSGALNLSSSPNFRLVGLAGFRYLNLTENLALTDAFPDPVSGGGVFVHDSFGTMNHFYGAQLGLRMGFTYQRFTFDGVAKAAFGENSQYLGIGGQTVVTNGAFGLTGGPGGVFAQPSNIGTYHRDQFAIVPEAQFQIGYLLTPYVRPFIGYNFIYFSRVLRPGNQLDRVINPSQDVTFGGTGGVLTGLPAPLPGLHNSDFWAQGVNFGVEFRY